MVFMDSINVLMSVNKNFLEHARDMMFSVLFYSSRFVNLYLMYQEQELLETDLKYITDFVSSTNNGKVIPIKFDTDKLSNFPTELPDGSFVGKETFARLFIAFNLPENVDKLLYLDADMICTGDVSELYDISFDNCSWVRLS